MTQYIYTIPVLLLTVVCMLFLTATNEHLLSAHRKAFFVAFSGAFFIMVCEVVSVIADGATPVWKSIHFLSNYLGFLLTPVLVAFFATAIGRFHRVKGFAVGAAAYFVFYNVLVMTKQLFFVDAQNNYHRGSLFFLYVIFYFCAVVYLFYETLKYSQKGFIQHKVFIYILAVGFLSSSLIQVLKPDVYITRITIILCLCMYFAYNLELTNLFDKLTGVLNQATYLRKVKELKPEQIVAILDIDNFKYINDHYGHQYGDKCMAMISETMRTVFANYGQCYRIGGDEFAIIIRKCHNVERLFTRFEDAITARFKKAPYQVTISLGYSQYEKDDTAEAVVKRADFNMYEVKNQKKAKKGGF